MPGVSQYHNVGMGVHVDETGADHESASVNYTTCLRRLQLANGGYPVALEANITIVPGAASPINYLASPYNHVKHGFSLISYIPVADRGTSLLYSELTVKL
ncbi:hypothetical protein ES703_115614 [subsurface metagenome]